MRNAVPSVVKAFILRGQGFVSRDQQEHSVSTPTNKGNCHGMIRPYLNRESCGSLSRARGGNPGAGNPHRAGNSFQNGKQMETISERNREKSSTCSVGTPLPPGNRSAGTARCELATGPSGAGTASTVPTPTPTGKIASSRAVSRKGKSAP